MRERRRETQKRCGRKRMRRAAALLLALLLVLVTPGCARQEGTEKSGAQSESPRPGAETAMTSAAASSEEARQGESGAAAGKSTAESAVTVQSAVAATSATAAETAAGEGPLVVIDAGHQARGNSAQEPIGPGSSTTKAKVSSGTQGVATGVPEYQLNLDIALLLQEELLSRGYEVLMVRTDNEVDLPNSERARIANEAGADAFVRIHANGSSDSSAQGAMALCQTRANPWNGALYERSRRLSDCVLDAYTRATGIARERVWETDTMSGINYCQVPVTLLELGYMTNPGQDRQMQDEAFQKTMAGGIADGLDAYFGR